MLWTKTFTPVIYLEEADGKLVEQIEEVAGVIMVHTEENKTYAIIHPEANHFEVEIEIKELINETS